MRHRRALLGAALAVAIIALWWWARPVSRSTVDGAHPPAGKSGDRAPAAAGAPSSVNTGTSRTVAEESFLADDLNAPAGTIEQDLRIVLGLLEAFRTNFPREGNPVGSNSEITAALQGRNANQVAFVPRGHPAVNRDGELCDRWGTPFFFHAESARRMEVRSAGPDRRLWTEDDVVLTP